MKKIINYEKDILFKTNIGEISTISLEHDFTVDDDILKGEFIVSGEYKTNELCINKEKFEYRLPLEYELEPTVDKDTLSFDIDNFEYTTKDDCLSVIIDFGVRYEEEVIIPKIPIITEEELNMDDFESTIELPELTRGVSDDMDIQPEIELEDDLEDMSSFEEIVENPTIILPEIKREEPYPAKIIEEATKQPEVIIGQQEVKSPRVDKEGEQVILDTALETDEYITYHVHIVREGESLESIASAYGVTTEIIKEYNHIETLEFKSKLIIPDMNE